MGARIGSAECSFSGRSSCFYGGQSLLAGLVIDLSGGKFGGCELIGLARPELDPKEALNWFSGASVPLFGLGSVVFLGFERFTVDFA